MPEHAVKAYSELNGTLFHGRMFHILPGKANDNQDDDEDENSTNFKAKKQKELKKTAGSSHNWNTLFLGENAVAEILSKNFGKSKEEVISIAFLFAKHTNQKMIFRFWELLKEEVVRPFALL